MKAVAVLLIAFVAVSFADEASDRAKRQLLVGAYPAYHSAYYPAATSAFYGVGYGYPAYGAAYGYPHFIGKRAAEQESHGRAKRQVLVGAAGLAAYPSYGYGYPAAAYGYGYPSVGYASYGYPSYGLVYGK